MVQKFLSARIGLYAAKSYVERMGLPKSEADFPKHEFVVGDSLNNRAPFYQWLYDRIEPHQMVFRTSELRALEEAIGAGTGIGFLSNTSSKCPSLVEVMPMQDEWSADFWLVTHMDLHRTAKVQAFLTHLKAESKDWEL